jgi:ferredoxin
MSSARRSRLKRLRVAFALIVLLPALLAFVDFGLLLPASAAAFLARTQLVPNLLRSVVAPLALLPVGLVALSALLVGRVYCSTLCPLGTLQDGVIRLAAGHRRRRRLTAPPLALHLAAASAVGLLAAAGVMLPLALTEPFGSFGRTLSLLVRPLVAWSLNGLSRLLGLVHVYALTPVQVPQPHLLMVTIAAAWLVGILALAWTRGRHFCNLLCPAGALLRLLSLRAAFPLRIDPASCTACGRCEQICKAGCIDAGERRVDFDACVGCFDCLDVCPGGAFGHRRRSASRRGSSASAEDEPLPDASRRRALQRTAALAGGAMLVGAAPGPARRPPITPPGSRGTPHFTARCTACQLCVGVCPTQVLRPSLLEYGVAGLMQPRLVFAAGACVYDCNACGQVCPTGAILPLPLPEKQRVQIGTARFVAEECVVNRSRTICGACAEHCPTRALELVPLEGRLMVPRVNQELCIGCGACEHPCPATPKAIFVEPCSPHGLAKVAAPSAPDARPDPSADFPF